VAHHTNKPFKVKVNDTEVKVLGTHFNIMAYHDEKAINTTLLEGSVSISKRKETVLLKPGQQAQIQENGKIDIVRNADVEQAIAWKNGVFNFNGSDIETTMRQIARWYDIEVIYEDKISEHFNGTIPRNASIEKVLTMLEYTGVVHFNMQKRKIIVRS
jgi:ferric-dicitrate binding protein FerR (iron transport regulator)